MGLTDREIVESDGSQEESEGSAATVVPDGSGTAWRGGVSINTDGSPEETDVDEDPDNSPSLSLSSNSTPGKTECVTQPDRGSEG